MNIKIDYGNKSLLKNSIYSFIYKIFSMVLSFISAPLLLNCLGVDKYGVWISIGSLISWIYYSDLGIGSGLRNKLASSLAKEDLKMSKVYIAISYVLISVSTVIFFLLLILIIVFGNVDIKFNLLLFNENVKLCIIVAIGFTCLNFILSIVNNILYALQRASLVSFFGILAQFFYTIMLLIYYWTGISFVLYVAIGEGLCQMIKNLIESVYVFKKYPELKFKLKDVDTKYSKDILSFGILIFIMQISSYIHNSTDNLVISSLFNAGSVTPYNFCYKYFNMINTIYIVIITPLISAYTVAFSKGNKKWLKSTLNKNLLLFGVFTIGTIIAGVFFEKFSKLWLHKSLYYEKKLIIFTMIYFILLMFSHIYSSFLTGVSAVKEYTIAVGIGAIINIPVSIFFAKYRNMGISGVMFGSIVSLLLNIIVGPLKTSKIMKKINT